MNKISKHIISFAIVSLLVLPLVAMPALAQVDNFGFDPVENGLNNTLSNSDPREIVGRIINMALGFLGVIAVIIILLGGFKWMTAGGNEDKVAEARKLLGAGIIGLVIVLAAWALATFIVGSIYNATNGG